MFFHIVHHWLRRARLRAVLLAVGEGRSDCAQDAQASEKGAHRRQGPGNQAREARAEQRHPEKGAARGGGDGVLVRLEGGCALLDDGGHHPRDGGSRSRAAADDTGACPAICGVHPALRAHPRTASWGFQTDLPAFGDVVLEELFHLRGEVLVFDQQVYLPVGDQAAEVQVRRSYLREPAVGHERLGVDHGPAVLEDPDPRLQELLVARARGPAYPGYVDRGRCENPHIDAVAGRGHQRLGEDGKGEEVRVGYPEALLHAGREQLQHAQGPHPSRFLHNQARGRLPRRLDVFRIRTLALGQFSHQLAPQAGEGTVDVGDHRSPHAYGGVPVGQARVGGGHEPAVGDAHPTRGGVLAVYGEQLAVVAPDGPERRTRGWRVYSLDLHASLPHAPPEGAGHVHATEPVVKYPHPHALPGLRGQGTGEPVADHVVRDDVVVQVDPTLRPPDGCEPFVVSIRAVF